MQLLVRGGVVHPVDQRRALGLQRLGGADVGLDHHLLDQLVGFEGGRGVIEVTSPSALSTILRSLLSMASGLRAARPFFMVSIGGPQRRQDGVHQRAGLLARLAVGGGLGLLVGQLGGRAHQAAHEAVAGLAARLVEHHPHRQAGAVLAFAQAAQAVGQPFGQHRLHPVGEVDAVALLAGLLVERRARADVGGDVGDGDPHHPALDILGVVVGVGVDGVVVVAGVHRVDGDQRQVAQVLAAAQGRRLGRLASASAAGEKPVGMPWAWMAISEAARGWSSRPITSSSLAGLGPIAACGSPTAASTRSPSFRSRPSASERA
jgi:hypothetical protein